MNLKSVYAIALGAALLGAGAPALAQTERGRVPDESRVELDRARQEVEKARQELQRATRELARSLAESDRDNPRAQYFEYMTDPQRAVLGVLINDESERGEDRGVRLLAVTPGSGAEKAGLKAGDLVTALNGTPLARDGRRAPQKRMREVMRTLKAGDEVKVEYERDGRKSTASLKTQAPEAELAMAPLPMWQQFLDDESMDRFLALPGPPGASMLPFRGAAIRGLELARLDPDLGAYFKTTEGVLVIKAPKSGALGLKSGDVIQKIDGDPVTEPVTVLDKLRSRGAEQDVKLDIVRQGKKSEIAGKIPAAERRKERRRIEIHTEDEDGG